MVYDPRQTKATTLYFPALQYIHYILGYTVTRYTDNNAVVNYHDFNFLLGMVDGFHIHLGYEVVVSITHQGIDARIGALFVCPYIIHVIRYVGLLQGTDCMRIVGGFLALSLETLRSLGML